MLPHGRTKDQVCCGQARSHGGLLGHRFRAVKIHVLVRSAPVIPRQLEQFDGNKNRLRFSWVIQTAHFPIKGARFIGNDLADQRFVLARVGGDQPAASASYEIDESGGNGTLRFWKKG